MSFEMIKDDIVNLSVDADGVVCAVNPDPTAPLSVESRMYQQGGTELAAARQSVGLLELGQAAITMGYDLDSIYMIHVAVPTWKDGTQGEAELLTTCYEAALELAYTHNCRSAAFQLLGVGELGFPEELAKEVATKALETFLVDHEMEIYLVTP